jgi:hypothetical protein
MTTDQLDNRPPLVTDEYLKFLDGIREAGLVNMFAAGPLLVIKYKVTRAQSHAILGYWMASYGARHRGEANT